MPFPRLADHDVVSGMYTKSGSAYVCSHCRKKYCSETKVRQHLRSVHQEKVQAKMQEPVPTQRVDELEGKYVTATPRMTSSFARDSSSFCRYGTEC